MVKVVPTIWGFRGLAPGLVTGLLLGTWVPMSPADDTGTPPASIFYSTAAPPVDFPGPAPVELAMAELRPEPSRTEDKPTPPEPAAPTPPETEAPRVAAAPKDVVPPSRSRPSGEEKPSESRAPETADPIVFAKQSIAECRTRFAKVQDYTCTFLKRERIRGRLGGYNVMAMKARNHPFSIYFKFQQPNAGREAIYVAGRNRGLVVAHDVGIGKVVAGTLELDPKGSRAMEECRHPITDAGIGHLIETVSERWNAEMKQGETAVVVHPKAHVGNRSCTMIESTHPQHLPRYMFYRVRVYIDHELGLPIRFEAYDWPRRAGSAPELVEEYTYTNLRLDVGLQDREFDPSNSQYSFGRF